MISSRIRTSRYWIAALSMLLSGLAFGQTSSKSEAAVMVPESDQAFVREALATGSLEIQISRIAALRANSEQVRQFALSLMEDHSKARRKLKEIALSKNVEIKDDLDRQRARRLLAVQRYTGDEFDREYLTLQVDQHRRAVQLFHQQAQRSGSEELRNFAQSKLPALEAHFKLAQSLADSR